MVVETQEHLYVAGDAILMDFLLGHRDKFRSEYSFQQLMNVRI